MEGLNKFCRTHYDAVVETYSRDHTPGVLNPLGHFRLLVMRSVLRRNADYTGSTAVELQLWVSKHWQIYTYFDVLCAYLISYFEQLGIEKKVSDEDIQTLMDSLNSWIFEQISDEINQGRRGES